MIEPTGTSSIQSMDFDQESNLVIGGFFTTEMTWDTGPVQESFENSSIGTTLFINKIDDEGNIIWSWIPEKSGNGTSKLLSLVADESGNIYFTGSFRDTLVYNADNPALSVQSVGGDDVLIGKLSADGELLWMNAFGGSLNDDGYSITVDTQGNAYVGGHFRGTINIPTVSGPIALSNEASSPRDVFMLKLNTEGVVEWVGSASGPSFTDMFGVAAIEDGGVIWSLTYQQSVSIHLPGSAEHLFSTPPGTGLQGILMRCSSVGEVDWAHHLSASEVVQIWSINVDSSNRIAVNGYYSGQSNFMSTADGEPLESVGTWDGFLAIYNGMGEQLWTQTFFDSTSVGPKTVSVDAAAFGADGALYSAGTFSRGLNNPASSLSYIQAHNNNRDVWITKFDSTGGIEWFRHLPTTQLGFCFDLAINPDNSLFLLGTFGLPFAESAINVHPGPLEHWIVSSENFSKDYYLVKWKVGEPRDDEHETSTGSNLNAEAGFALYPNPAMQQVVLDGLQSGDFVSIYDARGSLMLSFNPVSSQMLLPVHQWATGMYLVLLNRNDRIHRQKLVVGR